MYQPSFFESLGQPEHARGRAEGEARKESGMEVVAAKNERWIESTRRKLIEIAMKRRDRRVTTDDAHHAGIEVPAGAHPNAWGSIFHDRRFVRTTDRIKSSNPSAHAREISVWRYVGPDIEG